MARTSIGDEAKLLSALAQAMVEHPRANLQELARATGVSKATLYRFCGTRDLLIERLMKHATMALRNAIQNAELESPSPLEALNRLAVNCLKNQESILFLMLYWQHCSPIEQQAEAELLPALDEFFLRGQQANVFRVDVPAAALTELWIGMVAALEDAERRGRVARVGLPALLESVFLRGTARP